ncbi:MAG: chloramphenicol acetyltransferase [Oscillospiraceae bacterium]|nr:chloramphenicol acetyltransferase [Oscillospiraceae bacterium]
MGYRVIDKESYYRKGVFRHFSEDCKCSCSMTARIDVTELAAYSRRRGTKFYINFLYLLSKVINSRDDYKMGYLWQIDELICYDVMNPTQYVFHEDTETCTPVYTAYDPDYAVFYANALRDVEEAKKTREYGLDAANHPNWFDASYISWLSYDSLNIELPDGYLYLAPIVNWGRYREENGRLLMPVSVRLNHAVADGYLVAQVFRLLEREMKAFVSKDEGSGSPSERTAN